MEISCNVHKSLHDDILCNACGSQFKHTPTKPFGITDAFVGS